MPQAHALLNNVVEFPSKPLSSGWSSGDINALITEGKEGFVLYAEGDGYYVENSEQQVVWRIMPVRHAN